MIAKLVWIISVRFEIEFFCYVNCVSRPHHFADHVGSQMYYEHEYSSDSSSDSKRKHSLYPVEERNSGLLANVVVDFLISFRSILPTIESLYIVMVLLVIHAILHRKLDCLRQFFDHWLCFRLG